jgi:hypothetical protein
MKRLFVSWGILLVLAMASCAPVTTQQIPSLSPWLTRWLESPACRPPCWEGITPGVTSYMDATVLIEHIPDTQITYRINSRLEWNMDKLDGGWLTTDKEKVAWIRLFLNSEEVLPLSKLIGLYGQASEVRLNSCQGGYCEVDLIFTIHRMVVQLLLSHGPNVPYTVTILANADVRRINFYQDMKTYRSSPANLGNQFLPWRGYGDYP